MVKKNMLRSNHLIDVDGGILVKDVDGYHKLFFSCDHCGKTNDLPKPL